jgi:hypothetical protein
MKQLAVIVVLGCSIGVLPVMTWQGAQSQAQAPPPVPPRAITPPPAGGPTGAASAPATPVPLPLTEEAQRHLDQWKQMQAQTVDQMRSLQLFYRESGRAEEAAAVAAHIRVVQGRSQMAASTATVELVNEGLPVSGEPIRMSSFRNREGQILSFAIRGRDDQLVWGTGTYTDDSAIETAAVHTGMLRKGQTGIVKVRILPGQDLFKGTTQHGVQSATFGRHEGSFVFTAVNATVTNRSSSMATLRDLVGHSITLPVVGVISTSVWGSDIYTDNSSVAAAAVHSGLVQVGEFGWVKVVLMPPQPRFDGSPRNGINSRSIETWEGNSFRLDPAGQPLVVQLPGGEDASRIVSMDPMRGRQNTSFVVQVVGSTSGPVWGSQIYTDDSLISSAAVHAGLLKVGELGLIKVTIAPGRESYTATEANGVRSQPYGPWDGSYRIERVK